MPDQQPSPFCNNLRSDIFDKHFEKTCLFYNLLLLRYIYKASLIIFITAFSHVASFASDAGDLVIKNEVTNRVSNVYFYKNKKIASTKKTDIIPVKIFHQSVSNNLNKKIHTQKHRWVERVLLNHYRADTNDPQYIKQDIIELSRYYAQFPDVLILLDQLNDHPWSFQYKHHTSLTKASGTALRIKKAEIFIDTRGSVQYKKHRSCAGKRICTAAPSDVLLHELIHTHIMLTTNQFIEDGGMGTMLYPHRHEYNVIKLETNLYTEMSRIDKLKRPLRNSHKGKYVLSSCVTCVR
ncbi:MAG TPA: hypothetical protein ENJ08_14935 [Gammaproteobacteria bacterium]|nr:hypothetical protein [Gammaproteobacteria bacterium]